MSADTPAPTLADLEIQQTLDAFQEIVGRGNAARGFHEEGDRLRRYTHPTFKHPEPDEWEQAEAALRNYYVAKAALIHTEISEAVEELRAGHAADHVYYSEGGKPEGFMVEIVDAVIRCFDLADEVGVSLGALLLEKLKYNASRGRLHGGKSF